MIVLPIPTVNEGQTDKVCNSLGAYFLLRHDMLEYQYLSVKVAMLTISTRIDEFDVEHSVRRLTLKFHL